MQFRIFSSICLRFESQRTRASTVFSFRSANVQGNLISRSAHLSASPVSLGTHDVHIRPNTTNHEDACFAGLDERDTHREVQNETRDGSSLLLPRPFEGYDQVTGADKPPVLELPYNTPLPQESGLPITDEAQIIERSLDQAKKRVTVALRSSSTYAFIPSLLQAARDPTFLRGMRKSTIREMYMLLDFERSLQKYKEVYQDIHPHQLDQLQTSKQPSVTSLVGFYFFQYQHIIELLIAEGRKWGIVEFKWLLNAARVARHGGRAFKIWKDMLKCNVKPDTDCYNHYFEALCWSNAHDPAERRNQRVTPWRLERRRWRFPAESEKDVLWRSSLGYRTGPSGLKEEVVSKFTEMVAGAVMADATTFGHLMTAYAREGDMEGVKTILKRVWDIDVDAVMETENNVDTFIDIPAKSPLYPKEDLLFTIAHIFGINNDLAQGMRLVDYMSSKFSLKITNQTWAELLRWAFVLSRPRRGNSKFDGQQIGQLPSTSLESLYKTMTAPPYKVKLNMSMLDLVVKYRYGRKHLDQMLSMMIEGLKLHNRTLISYARASEKHFSSLAQKNSVPWVTKYLHTQSPLFHRKNVAGLQEFRDFLLISRWFSKLLRQSDWYSAKQTIVIWERQKLPEAINAFWYFRPKDRLSYSISTGRVDIFCGSKAGYDESLHEYMPKRNFVHFPSHVFKTNGVSTRRALRRRLSVKERALMQISFASLLRPWRYRIKQLPRKKQLVQSEEVRRRMTRRSSRHAHLSQFRRNA